MTTEKACGDTVRPPKVSGTSGSPSEDGDTRLESIRHRRNLRTGKFEGLRPEDRQMRLPYGESV